MSTDLGRSLLPLGKDIMIELVEFIKRSEKGVTRPFIFKGADKKTYYVKGASASHRSLICEWIGGQLAKKIGLNIPNFDLGYVDAALFRVLPNEMQRDLGSSEVFVSEAIPHAKDIKWEQVQHIPNDEKTLIALFDLWVRNEDRTMRADTQAGNPNLLIANGIIYVIDHNLIFDENFNINQFKETHIFSEVLVDLQSDMVKREAYRERLTFALQCWASAWDQTPEDWKDTKAFNMTLTKSQLDEDIAGTLWTRLS